MKTIFIFLALALAFSSNFARAGGNSEAHGGDAVEVWEPFVFQLYSLDLAEMGLGQGGRVNLSKVTTSEQVALANLIRKMNFNDDYFGNDVIAALTNKLLEIKSISPALYEALAAEISDLKIVWVDTNLIRIADDKSTLSGVYQMAARMGKIVRVTKYGWTYDFLSESDGKWRGALDSLNKSALITHELIYSITSKQGDTDSTRARLANAQLYSSKDVEANIRLAENAILGQH